MSKIAQIKITLSGVRPPIWRRVLIDTSSTLADLHQVIQCVMGWTNSHLHAFEISGEYYEPDPNDPDMIREVKDEHRFTIKKVLSWGVREFEYLYDFGDSWLHRVQIEKLLASDPSMKYPVCIKGKRACPTEDVGGSWGYTTMIKALKGPDSPEKQEFLDWLDGKEFNPEAFDLEESNFGLPEIQPGTTDARNAFV